MTAPRLQSIAMRKARRQILVADMAIHDRLSITEIARKVGSTRQTVGSDLDEMGIAHAPERRERVKKWE